MCWNCAEDARIPNDHHTTTVQAAADWQHQYALPAEPDHPTAAELEQEDRWQR